MKKSKNKFNVAEKPPGRKSWLGLYPRITPTKAELVKRSREKHKNKIYDN